LHACMAMSGGGRKAVLELGQELELTCERLALEGKVRTDPGSPTTFLLPLRNPLPSSSPCAHTPHARTLPMHARLQGICLLPPSGFVVMVEQALPGERLTAEVTAVKRGFAEARKLRTLAPHAAAVEPRCPHFGPCGGCTLQSMDYTAQLQEKQNQVRAPGDRPSHTQLNPHLAPLSFTPSTPNP
jgi:hypothetical protein